MAIQKEEVKDINKGQMQMQKKLKFEIKTRIKYEFFY